MNYSIVNLKELTRYDIELFYSGYLPRIDYSYKEDFQKSYPEFLNWLKRIQNSKDRKEILLFKNRIPVGFSILKYSERKICSFYIIPYFRGKGYSSILLRESIKELNTKYPLITISDKVKDNFVNLFSKYDFKLIAELDNLYRENSIEYIFNKEFIK